MSVHATVHNEKEQFSFFGRIDNPSDAIGVIGDSFDSSPAVGDPTVEIGSGVKPTFESGDTTPRGTNSSN